ncbi:MAG: hypothetical protein QXH91_00615 [Candidatus Bathyarchaeia archaeon]
MHSMIIESFQLKIMEFEEMLQKLSSITSDIVSERLPPPELWSKSETVVSSLGSLSEELKSMMLLLKPEKASAIKRQFDMLSQPLDTFRDILFQKPADRLTNSRLSLEHLRKAIVEGTNFLNLANEIKENPSGGISEILKLKEVYETKRYLSNVSIPEAVYVRFNALRRNMENLKLRLSELERTLEELSKHIDNVQEEMSKFQPASIESSAEKTSSESALSSE